jgi:pyruvate/2-oxoacid:ferredoxin oxidoreductase alpha subunit
MKLVLTGNETVGYAVIRSRVQVISAYPITPQTTIIEMIAELIAKGKLDIKFIKVESEHSAMAGCIGAAQVGARTFTATSAQGLTLMHEMLHWAANARLPVVMANVNRGMAPGWSIWTDQIDSLSQRDTGWMQFYCENNQEVMDTIIQAYKISEKVLLPAMIVLDAFVLSHTAEIVDVPEQEEVDEFLPPWKGGHILDVENPKAFGGLIGPDVFQEFRFKLQNAMQEAMQFTKKVCKEWKDKFGREYDVVIPYMCDDAEIVLVASATTASTARITIDRLRDKKIKAGLLRVRLFRPFPTDDIREHLSGKEKVAVFDRNISFGHHGIFCQEIKSALYNFKRDERPIVFGYIGGLGGRDITPELLEDIIHRTLRERKPKEEFYWVGHKP